MASSFLTIFPRNFLVPPSVSPSPATSASDKFQLEYYCPSGRSKSGAWVTTAEGLNARKCVVEAKGRTSAVQTYWVDKADGSDSDFYDEEGEEAEAEETDLDVESDWEEDRGRDFTTSAIADSDGNDEDVAKCYEEELMLEVKRLLEPHEREILQQNKHANLEKISTAKWRPLQTLGLSLQISFMDKLIENGVDIDDVDKDGLTALHKAIIGKKEAVISHLLRKGANPHIQDKDGATPLHYAVHVGAMQTVKLLIKFGVDVNMADNEGWTPLHIAVQSRNRDIVKILLVNGADKTRRTKDGKTFLDLALCYGRDFKSYDLAKLLKTVPADVYP